MSDAERRAADRRARWSLQRVDTLSGPPLATTPEEGIRLCFELSEHAWRLSGRPWPDYERAEMPGRILRPGDDR